MFSFFFYAIRNVLAICNNVKEDMNNFLRWNILLSFHEKTWKESIYCLVTTNITLPVSDLSANIWNKFQRYFSQTYGTLPRSVLRSLSFPPRKIVLPHVLPFDSLLERYWRKKRRVLEMLGEEKADGEHAAFPSFLHPGQIGNEMNLRKRNTRNFFLIQRQFSSRSKRNWIHKSTVNRYTIVIRLR